MASSATNKFSVSNLKPPAFVHFLFGSPKMAWLWLIVRVWLGYQWIEAGWGKVTNPAWVQTGDALKGFLGSSIEKAMAAGSHSPIAYNWFLGMLQGILDSGAYTWMGKVVAFGELLVGIALVLGLFTAYAAFFSGFMVWNYAMAGTAGVAPMFLVLSALLIVAWRIAGLWGLDRWRFEYLGIPGQAGKWFSKK